MSCTPEYVQWMMHTGKVDVCPVSDVRNADRRDFDHEESEDPYIVSLIFIKRTGKNHTICRCRQRS